MSDLPPDQNTDSPEVDFALMDQLVEANPDLNDAEILTLYQKHSKAPHYTVALISDDLNEATKVILASALPEPNQPKNTHSQAQYRIDHKLDSGGQSHVYLAHRNDGTYQKTVVVKVLNQSIEGATQKQQLMAEMQILADFNHPNIVKIIDAGIDEQQRPWMMLDYIQGEHIDKFIAANALNQTQWLVLTSRIAKALRYVHDKQVVHADIKPANILVNMEDDLPNPIIIDFGIANTLQSQTENSPYVFATPAFAAPEQLDQKLGQTDQRSDVFAFGCLMQCLIKTHIENHQKQPPLNAEFYAVISHCVHDDPNKRYQKTAQLVQDIESLKSGEAVSVVNQNPFTRMIRAFNRHRWQTIIGMAVIFSSLLLINHAAKKSELNQALIEGAQSSQHYWQSADEITSQLRLIYALPKRNIEADFATLNNQFESLIAELSDESKATKNLSLLPLADAAISLGRYQQAQELLLQAHQSDLNNAEIQFKLGKNYLILYQNEVQQLQNISSITQRQTQRARLQTKYFTPALKFFKQSDFEDAVVNGLLAYFDGNYSAAITKLQAADSQLLWPIERLILMAQIAKEQANNSAVNNHPKLAAEQLQTAQLNLKKAIQIARSHPEVHRQMCQVESLILQLETKQSENHIRSCDTYLELLPNDVNAVLVVADAYTQLAKSWLTDGHAPRPLIEHARQVLNQQWQQQANTHTKPQTAHAQQLLGNLLSIEGKWQLYSNHQFTQYFEQAVEHHQKAVDLQPTGYTTQLDLASAWYNLANNTNYQSELTDHRFNQANQILTELNHHADSTEFLQAFLVRVLTDHAYIRYQHGKQADQQLNQADAIVQQLRKDTPENVYAQLAIATLYWTYTDYLVLQNKNPTEYLPLATSAFDHVIAAEPDQWTNRYNQISAMLSGATYFLNQQQVQRAELQIIEEKLSTLKEQISGDISLDSHYGYFYNLMAMNAALGKQQPTQYLEQAYTHNLACADSPIDGPTCLAELAHSLVIASAWQLKTGDTLPSNRLALSKVNDALRTQSNNQPLLVRMGEYHWLKSQKIGADNKPRSSDSGLSDYESNNSELNNSKLALKYLNQACNNNKLLAIHYAEMINDIESSLNTLRTE